VSASSPPSEPLAEDPGLRVLHVFGGLEVGGAETWLSTALAHGGLRAAYSHDFCLLSSSEGPLAAELRSRGHRVLHVPLVPRWSFPQRLFSFLRRRRYDAVHSHVLLFSGVTLAVARAAGIRLRIAHAHNDSDGRASSWTRGLYRRGMRRLIAWASTDVVGCTRRAALAAGGTERTLRVLPYGVALADSDAPRPSPGRAALLDSCDLPPDARVWGHIGRMAPQKNQRFLLEAFAAAYHADACSYLVIAGEGPLRSGLEAYAEGLGVADRVRFLGLRRDAGALLDALFDVLVLPSLHEGLPVVLLEAQAAGLPCLISDAVNPDTVVLEEQVQSLPLSAGFTAWSEAAQRLSLRPRIDGRVAAQRLRRARFDAGQSWERLLALYQPERDRSGDAPLQPVAGVSP